MNKIVSLTKETGKTVTKFNISANGIAITRRRTDLPGRPNKVLYLTLDEMETIYGELSELANSSNVED